MIWTNFLKIEAMNSKTILFILISIVHIQITVQDKLLNDCLKETNKYRGKHHSPPMKIDQNIIAFAKKRCKQVVKPGYLDKGHAAVAPKDHGENIYRTSATKIDSCKKAVDKWYNEIKMYSFSKPEFSESTAHFITLVWKASTKMGCATCNAKGVKGFNTYLVCNYKTAPYSKVLKELKANVKKI